MKKLISVFTLLAFMACTPEPVDPGPQSSAEIRILNATTWTFSNCTVDPTGKFSGSPSHNFGTVTAGAYTDYHTFPNIYRYAPLKLTMQNKEYSLTPIDYVGETPLSSGKYTYKLSYLSSGDRLQLECIP